MNYKEQYEQALERAKEIHKVDYKGTPNRDIAEYIFPELVEDEDERIRKEIIQFLQLPHPQFVGKRNYEKWIAWLEKQKNVTSIENKDLSKCSDDIKDFMETFCEDEPKAYWDGCADTLEWIKTHPDNQFCKRS